MWNWNHANNFIWIQSSSLALLTRSYWGSLLRFVNFQVANYENRCIKTKISDPNISHLDIPKKNFAMACYTVSLTSNETIYCRTIRSFTVNLYITDAAKLAILNHKPDPTKTNLIRNLRISLMFLMKNITGGNPCPIVRKPSHMLWWITSIIWSMVQNSYHRMFLS